MNTMIAVLNRLGGQWVAPAFTMLVQSSVVIGVLAALDFLLRNRTRAIVRYSLWMLLLLKLVLPVNFSLPTGLLQLEGVANYQAPVYAEPVQAPPVSVAVTERVASPELLIDPPRAARIPRPEPRIELSPLGGVVLVWGGIVLSLAGFAAWRSLQLRRLIDTCHPATSNLLAVLESCREQMGVRQRVELLITQQNLTPALCGILRARIIFPATLAAKLSDHELRAVLLHELAHVRRRDVLVNAAQTVLQIAYFFHPLLWLANARIRKLREQAVDELVLVTLGAEADVYPETLLDVAKFSFKAQTLAFGTVGIMESRSAFGARIRRMLSRPFPTDARLGVICVATLAAFVACILPMASRAKEKASTEPAAAPPAAAREFLATLRYYPDPNFSEYKKVTNRIVELGEALVPLILSDLQTPLAEMKDAQLRLKRGTKMWALEIIGDKARSAVPTLIKELESDDSSMHAYPHYMNYPPAFWAASALGGIGPAASNAAPALIDSAHFGNYRAVPALARIAPGSKEVVELAIDTFVDMSRGFGGNVNASRLAGLEALALLADHSTEARQTLFRGVRDGDAPIRNAVVKLILKSKWPGGREAIEKALAGDDLTRVNTAAALASAGEDTPEVREALVQGITHPHTRLKALEALTTVAPDSAQLLPTLLPLLQDPERNVRLAVLELLSRFRSSKSAALVKSVLPLIDAGDTQMTQAVMNALASNQVVTPEVVEALRNALRSPDGDLLQTALQTAEFLKPVELAPDIAALFKNRNKEARDRAVRSSILVSIGSFPEAAMLLLPDIESELQGEEGWAAAIALSKMGTNAAGSVPALTQSLHSTNDMLVQNVLHTLGQIGPAARPALPSIKAKLNSDKPLTQLNSALALWRIDRQPQIVAVLRDRLESLDHWDRLERLNENQTRSFFLHLVKEVGEPASSLQPLVERYANDSNPTVRRAATEALADIRPRETASTKE